MDVGAVLQIETVTQPQTVNAGVDPMQTRWGIQCAVRDKFIDGEKAGFPELSFARWFKVAHFTSPEEIHSTDDDPNFARERMVTKTARSVERYLDEMLGGKTINGAPDPNKTDWGIRFGFYGEEDVAKMEVISATLLPSLPEIRSLAAEYGVPCPIEDRCLGEDSVGFGERHTCPTCWLQWIESACCDEFIDKVANQGRQVEVIDILTRAVQHRTIQPALTELEAARLIIIESLKRGIVAAQQTWTDVATELDKGTRKGTDLYQNNLRKDLHAPKPQDAQLNQVREYARASAINQGGGDNSELLKMLATSQMQTNQLLGQLVAQKQTGLNIAETSEAPHEHYAVDDAVLVDGEVGVISEVKTAGWYVVETSNGSKTVRKDRLQKEG